MNRVRYWSLVLVVGLLGFSCVAPTSTHRFVTVASEGNARIATFDLDANGDVAPIHCIGRPTDSSVPLKMARSAAFDPVKGTLYVTDTEGTIYVFAPAAGGSGAPLVATISGSDTGLKQPWDVSVDTVHGEIVVANFDNSSVTVYRTDAHGNVKPVRTLAGRNTTLQRPVGVAVDARNNEIFVADRIARSITVFDRLADGDVRPKRVLRAETEGVRVDVAHNELLVNAMNPAVAVYSP